ncbi:MAG: DUF2628 domain-containing protein [Hyphomicrobiaceae bacterium]|nr:DUF2628 domain-containing protein [Hyphomicrobiaceae bacterium]
MIRTILRLTGDNAMATFTVHEPPDPPADRIERAERLVFIRDGFSFAAALLGPLWLLANRLWAALAVYLVVSFLLAAAITLGDGAVHWGMLAQAALAVLIGFEADQIRRWTLDRRGYTEVGTVVGRGEAECERRFIEQWLPTQPAIRVGTSSATAASVPALRQLAVAAPSTDSAVKRAGARRESFLTRLLRGRAPARPAPVAAPGAGSDS